MRKSDKKYKKVSIDLNMDKCPNFLDHITYAERNNEDVSHIVVENCELESNDLSCINYQNVVFSRCSFSKVSMESSSFDNVIFDECAFTNCNFTFSNVLRCEFKSCNFKGSDFTSSHIYNVGIYNSNFKYSNFTLSSFDICEIKDSDMSDTFYAECKLKYVELSNVKFVGAEFFRTSLKDLDFTSCDLEGICVSDGGKELVGAIVNSYQAGELAKLFGLVVKDDY